MPNPKTRLSKQRKRKRRTHDTIALPTLAVDKTTNETHLFHRAHEHDGKLYYRGKVLVDNSKSEE